MLLNISDTCQMADFSCKCFTGLQCLRLGKNILRYHQVYNIQLEKSLYFYSHLHVHMVDLNKSCHLPFSQEKFHKQFFFTDLLQKPKPRIHQIRLGNSTKNTEIHRVLVYSFLSSLFVATVICSDWKNRQGSVHPDL